MSPTIEAAIIAASVGVLTLIGTLAAQYFGRRATSRDTQKALEEQSAVFQAQRSQTLNERFATAAGQLGDDKPPAVRLAGVYALAGLADDWPENRQTCVDVLCGYLRLPYEPDPGEDAGVPERLAFRAGREVRHTVIRLITAHLEPFLSKVPWQGLNFDFTGVVFDGGDFGYAEFSGGTTRFDDAQFTGQVSFTGLDLSRVWRGWPLDHRPRFLIMKSVLRMVRVRLSRRGLRFHAPAGLLPGSSGRRRLVRPVLAGPWPHARS